MAEPIKLIVGLGNPGERYITTRHNAGAWFVEKVVASYAADLRLEAKFHGFCGVIKIAHYSCHLLIPITYMNCSGRAVQAIANFYKIPPANILVVHDELDFPPGVARFKFGGGHNGHNGLRDIIAVLQGGDFHRLRVGIGKPQKAPNSNVDMADYVLTKPSRAEMEQIDAALDEKVALTPRLLQGIF